MKRLFFLSCTMLVIASSVTGQTTNVPVASSTDTSFWKRYTVKDEEFSITFPTVPAMATYREYREDAQKERQIREIGAFAEGVVYTIYSVSNPEPRQSLELFIKEHKERFGDVKTREVIISGFAGRESVDRPVQFFATANRLYAFSAVGATVEHSGAKQFFSSLSLGKKNEGIELSDGPGIPFPTTVQPRAVGDYTPDKMYTGREVDRKARLAMKPEPVYTEAARQNEITGTVVLKVIFSSNGMVENLVVVSGLPFGLTEKAIAAAKAIKFIPAVKDGKFVSMWMQLEYNFNLF